MRSVSLIVVAFATILSACSDKGPSASISAALAPKTPESLATQYVQSVLDKNQAAMKGLVASGSQAETVWPDLAKARKTTEGITVVLKNCIKDESKTMCSVNLESKDTGAFLCYHPHIAETKDGLQVIKASVGRAC